MKDTSCFIFLVILLTLLVKNGNGKSTLPSTDIGLKQSLENFPYNEIEEFSPPIILKPIYYGRNNQEINETNLEQNPNYLSILLQFDNRNLTLDLIINNHLISKEYFLQYQENGTNKRHKVSPEEVKPCHYTGQVRNKHDSWVAISTCDGLSGVIYDGEHVHYIEKKKNGTNIEQFLKTDESTYNSKQKKKKIRNKRETSIQQTRNFPPRYVKMILVVDNAKYEELNQSRNKVEEYCKNIINLMNGLYSPLNISIVLAGVVVWTERDEITISESIGGTLKNFLSYCEEKLPPETPNDSAQFLTKGTLNRAEGNRRAICSTKQAGSVISASSSMRRTAATAARGLAYNLGIAHDHYKCQCPDSVCIMYAYSRQSAVIPTHWSSCSVKEFEDLSKTGLYDCLNNKTTIKPALQSAMCGNGRLENGEECDCGLPKNCKNKCCNPKTCKLVAKARCAAGECCNAETCDFKESGKVCRQVTNECDLPEYCTGESQFCPADVYRIDTDVCANGRGYCYQGRCGIHDGQCNGITCGDGKKCLNQECVSVANLQESPLCPFNCYNNGLCNNLMHCHCKAGYLLPYCQYIQPGGSIDSGPPESLPSFANFLLL